MGENKKGANNYTMEKVTILTACKNSVDTIEQTILSVLNQTYKNIEYIIIDGASNDGTLDIIKKYERRLQYISEPDDGLYDAYNKGLKLATGDIVGIIDSNDWYTLDAVEKSVTYLCEHNVSYTYGDVIRIDDGTQRLLRGDRQMALGVARAFDFPTIFAKRELYEKFGSFNLCYKIYADLEWMLKLRLSRVSCCYVPYVMSFFRTDGLSSSPRYSHTQLREYRKIYNGILAREVLTHNEKTNIEKICHIKVRRVFLKYLKRRVTQYGFMRKYLLSVMKEKKKQHIAIWGVGNDFPPLHSNIRYAGILPRILVDNDTKKQGCITGGIMVLSPENICDDDLVIVSSRKYYKEIKGFLEAMGKLEKIDFLAQDDLMADLFRKYISVIAGITRQTF